MASALWIGDRVYGRNRYTGDDVTGTLISIEKSDLDGKEYATVEQSQPGWGPQTILAADLRGPRRCYNPKDENNDGQCDRCGRRVYPNGPYDTDRLSHSLARIHPRYHL